MSQVYATEPATTGRVIFETSHYGPIDISLWCKECPTACRAFLQRCVDGFFDDMEWHRIVPEFLLQTGLRKKKHVLKKQDLTQYQHLLLPEGDRQQYELHPRLRFNHRGQVAMALPVDNGDAAPDHLKHQFFITLEEAPYLDGKHVLFGTVRGPTMFNALRMGRIEVDDNNNNEPVDVPIIKSVTVDHHPFADLQPIPFWKNVLSQQEEEEPKKKKKKQRKGKRDLNVLSFGNEMQDDMGGRTGMQSSHDVVTEEENGLFPKKEADDQVKAAAASNEEGGPMVMASKKKARTLVAEDAVSKQSTNGPAFAAPVTRSETKSPEKAEDEKPTETETIREDSEKAQYHRAEQEMDLLRERQQRTMQKRSEVDARRAKYLQQQRRRSSSSGASKKQREQDTMAKLLAFKSKVVRGGNDDKHEKDAAGAHDNSLASRMARRHAQQEQEEEGTGESSREPPTYYHGQVLDHSDNDDDQEDGNKWFETHFKCRKHIDHASREDAQRGGADGRNAEDYDVIDGKKHSGSRKHHGHSNKRHDHRDRGDRHGGSKREKERW